MPAGVLVEPDLVPPDEVLRGGDAVAVEGALRVATPALHPHVEGEPEGYHPLMVGPRGCPWNWDGAALVQSGEGGEGALQVGLSRRPYPGKPPGGEAQ